MTLNKMNVAEFIDNVSGYGMYLLKINQTNINSGYCLGLDIYFNMDYKDYVEDFEKFKNRLIKPISERDYWTEINYDFYHVKRLNVSSYLFVFKKEHHVANMEKIRDIATLRNVSKENYDKTLALFFKHHDYDLIHCIAFEDVIYATVELNGKFYSSHTNLK